MRFRAHLVGACAVLALGVWLSSGTMTPVASTFFAPIVAPPCGYLYNVDHPLHAAAFRMLDGQPPERWRSSIVLRRILFPLVAYPFMKVAGFELGGFVASVLCQVAGLAALALFLRRRHGEDAALAGAWLLATYPGVTYWAALPYAYVAIVPASIGLFILLTSLGEKPGPRSTATTCLAMSVLFTAYDLLPFFGLAAVLVLLRRRRFADLSIALPALLVGPLLAQLLLRLLFDVGWANKNTAIYGVIARAYLHPPPFGVWLSSVSDFMPVLLANFFCSNMVFLPALFLIVVIVTRRSLDLGEAALLAAGAAIFLFNNLAPPYVGRWQMRGMFIPRLYQPVFVALVVYCARAAGAWRALSLPKARLVRVALALAVAGNASIVLGPVARLPWSGYIYHRFYMHSGPEEMDRQLTLHGRRPLGFCAPGGSGAGPSLLRAWYGVPSSATRGTPIADSSARHRRQSAEPLPPQLSQKRGERPYVRATPRPIKARRM